MSWTINDQTLEALGIRSAVVTFRSQAADEFEFEAGGEMTAILFAEGSSITLKQGGITRFSGVVRVNIPQGTGSAQGRKVIAKGPWFYLETASVKRPAFYWNPSSKIVDTRTAPEWSVDVGNTLKFAVEYLLDNAVPGQLARGTIDLDTTVIPEQVFENATYAETLIQILRWSPGAFTWVDYSHAPPRLNVIRGTSTSRSYAVPAADIFSLTYQPITDAKASGVVLAYDADWTVVSAGRWGLIDQRVLNFRWTTERHPSGATEGSPGVVFRRIKVPYQQTLYRQEVIINAYTLGELIQDTTSVGSWAPARRAAFQQMWQSINTGWTAVGPQHTASFLQIRRWEGDAPGSTPSISSLRWVPTRLIPEILNDNSTGQGIYVARVQAQIQVSGDGIMRQAEFYATTEPAGTRTYEFLRPVQSYVVTTGIAQKLYDQLQAARYQGSITLSTDAGDSAAVGKSRLVLPNPHPVIPGVQRLRWDLFSGRQQIDFGGNPILGPEDMISLLRPR